MYKEMFSLPIALTPKKTLLIGAGSVAWQKFSVLMEAKWEVCVWAKEICDERFKAYFGTDNSSLDSSNSFSGNHSTDSLDLERSQSASLASRPKSSENYESTTAIPSVVDSANLESKNNPSLRESATADSWQSIPIRHSDRSASVRSEESKHTNLLDSSLSAKAKNDGFSMDCHDFLRKSSNDGVADSYNLNCHDLTSPNLAMTDKAKCAICTLDSHIDLKSLKNFEVIIDASGDENLGAFLHSVRKECGFLLNVVDKPNFCDFYFGSIVRRENVSVMVSTNGTSPLLSQILRDKISAILPRTISALSHRLKSLRKTNPPKSKNAKDCIAKECQESLGKVFIIGCGPSDFGLLTLKAVESFALLDVALVDNLIGDEILTHIKNLGIECVNVGKRKGAANFTQKQINELMLSYAKQGKIVGRLKGGDPVIFGRVWEEASFLHSHNVSVEYISGVTSGLCGALTSGITPTLRGVSAGALIVSAHLRESVFHTEWIKWLKDSPYTLIVLMAHSFAERIRNESLAQGISDTLPAAFISKVSTPSQKAIIGTLGELPQMAQMCENPSILILGKAVAQSLNMPFSGERIALDSALKNPKYNHLSQK